LLNPMVLGNTRLAQLAPLFRRFKFNKFNIVYLPNQGTNTNGTIVLAYDHDAEAGGVPSDGSAAIQEAMAWNDTRTGSMFAPLTMTSSLRTPESPYWIDLNNLDTLRHNFQGQVLIMLANPVSVVSGTGISYPAVMGTIWVEYECELYDEQLNAALSVGYAGNAMNANVVTPATGTSKGWNQLTLTPTNTFGDIDDFEIVADTAGNIGLTVSRGIYTVCQNASISNPAAGVVLNWANLTWVANIPTEQSAFGEEEPTNAAFAGSTLAAGVTGCSQRVTTIVVPDGGGRIYGNWTGTNGGACTVFRISVTVQRAGQSILRALSPPTLASSEARCRRIAHPAMHPPVDTALVSSAQPPLQLCCLPHSH
jgi:hypothetical protein